MPKPPHKLVTMSANRLNVADPARLTVGLAEKLQIHPESIRSIIESWPTRSASKSESVVLLRARYGYGHP